MAASLSAFLRAPNLLHSSSFNLNSDYARARDDDADARSEKSRLIAIAIMSEFYAK